jgi:RNA polymerase sigma factor (sigma-70 family)
MDEPITTNDGGIDAELVSSYLAGDRSALGSIYDRYGQSLFDTATAMTNSRDDASDMVQDVFVLAAERLSQLRDPSRLKPWLFAILRNEVYRRSRRRSRQSLTDFSAPEHDAMLP